MSKRRRSTKKPYKNAAAILPPELLAELQKYHRGLLWIPKTSHYHKRRADLVVRLHGLGVSPKAIAERCEITTRRVRQILQERGISPQRTDG
jgi:hypothetical protein